jgi:adenine-specific DNA-methyltransferase
MYSIIETDSIKHMKNMDRESVDLIITSPPYAAKKEYESWDGLEHYKRFANDWMESAVPLLKGNGSLLLNVGYTKVGRNETLPLSYVYHEIAYRLGLKMVQEIVWRYYGGMAYKLRYTHRTERILWFTKDPDNCTFNLDTVRVKEWQMNGKKLTSLPHRCNPLGKNPTDIWEIKHVRFNNKKENMGHPCQFPEALIERLIRAHSNEGDMVLDPFLGSGTTCVIAERLMRDSIGLELKPEYIEMANKRMRKNGLESVIQ